MLLSNVTEDAGVCHPFRCCDVSEWISRVITFHVRSANEFPNSCCSWYSTMSTATCSHVEESIVENPWRLSPSLNFASSVISPKAFGPSLWHFVALCADLGFSSADATALRTKNVWLAQGSVVFAVWVFYQQSSVGRKCLCWKVI